MYRLTLLIFVLLWKQGRSLQFLHCWDLPGPPESHPCSVNLGLFFVEDHLFPCIPKRKGSPFEKAEAARHAATSALFKNGGQCTQFSRGVTPPSPPGRHFECGGGFVASGGDGPPRVARAVGWWAQPTTETGWEVAEKTAPAPLGGMGGAGTVERINYSWGSSQTALCASLCWKLSPVIGGGK